MRYFAISADTETLTGLRLSGIEGAVAQTKRETIELVEKICADESVAVLLITHACYELCPDTIDAIKLSVSRPLVTIIPAANEPVGESGSITRLIREAIGIKI